MDIIPYASSHFYWIGACAVGLIFLCCLWAPNPEKPLLTDTEPALPPPQKKKKAKADTTITLK